MGQKNKTKAALLVIDIQNFSLKFIPAKDIEPALFKINMFIDLFRKHDFPIIRIYHFNEQHGLVQGKEDFEFPISVSIKPEDPMVIKTYPDSFNKTDLNKVLKEKGCNTLFICGLSATGCALATWLGAFNHDYKAFLVKDALMSPNKDQTTNIEIMFDAVGYDVIQLILENADPEDV
jgi:nicotinamidase-related amidase